MCRRCAYDLRDALLQKFTSWHPGPVLFDEGENLKLILIAAYRGRIGTVLKH